MAKRYTLAEDVTTRYETLPAKGEPRASATLADDIAARYGLTTETVAGAAPPVSPVPPAVPLPKPSAAVEAAPGATSAAREYFERVGVYKPSVPAGFDQKYPNLAAGLDVVSRAAKAAASLPGAIAEARAKQPTPTFATARIPQPRGEAEMPGEKLFESGKAAVFRGLISPEQITKVLGGGRTPQEIQEELANPNIAKTRLEAFLLGAAVSGGVVASGFTSPFNIALVASGLGVAKLFRDAERAIAAARTAAAEYSALRATGAASSELIPAYQKAATAYEAAKVAHNTSQAARLASGAVGATFAAEGAKNFHEAKNLEEQLTAGAQVLFGAAGLAGGVKGVKFATKKPPEFRPAQFLPPAAKEVVSPAPAALPAPGVSVREAAPEKPIAAPPQVEKAVGAPPFPPSRYEQFKQKVGQLEAEKHELNESVQKAKQKFGSTAAERRIGQINEEIERIAQAEFPDLVQQGKERLAKLHERFPPSAAPEKPKAEVPPIPEAPEIKGKVVGIDADTGRPIVKREAVPAPTERRLDKQLRLEVAEHMRLSGETDREGALRDVLEGRKAAQEAPPQAPAPRPAIAEGEGTAKVVPAPEKPPEAAPEPFSGRLYTGNDLSMGQQFKRGIFFSPEIEVASEYVGNAPNRRLIAADVRLTNPLYARNFVEVGERLLGKEAVQRDLEAGAKEGRALGDTAELERQIASEAKRQGYDGIVYQTKSGEVISAVAFDRTGIVEVAREPGQTVAPPAPADLPPRTLDTMSEAISMSSPSGKVSRRAAEAARKGLSQALFGREGMPGPKLPAQPTEPENLLARAKNLRDLAARGMNAKAYIKEAEKLEANAKEEELARLKAQLAALPEKKPAVPFTAGTAAAVGPPTQVIPGRTAPVTQLGIRSSKYRGMDGFSVVGKDSQGRNISIFAETRESAEHIKAKVQRGEQITGNDFEPKPQVRIAEGGVEKELAAPRTAEAEAKVLPTETERRPDFENEQRMRKEQVLPGLQAKIEDALAKADKSTGTKRLATIDELRSLIVETRELQARIGKYESDPSQRPVASEGERNELMAQVRPLSDVQVTEAASALLPKAVKPEKVTRGVPFGVGKHKAAPLVSASGVPTAVSPVTGKAHTSASEQAIHKAAADRKGAIPVLKDTLVKNGEMISTDLEQWVTTKTSLPDGAYQLVGKNWEKSEHALDQFPPRPEISKIEGTLEVPIIADLARAERHISSEESRYSYNGALLKIEKGKLIIAATDGHRLTVNAVDAAGVKDQAHLIPRKAIQLLLKDKQFGPVKITFGANKDGGKFIELDNGRTKLLTRELTGTFPTFEAIIPRELKTETVADRSALESALKELRAYVNPWSRNLMVEPSPGKWTLRAHNREKNVGKALEVPTEERKVTGPARKTDISILMPMQVEAVPRRDVQAGTWGVNIDYLQDELAGIKGDKVYFGQTEPSNAIVIGGRSVVGEKIAPAAKKGVPFVSKKSIQAKQPPEKAPPPTQAGPGGRTIGATGEGRVRVPLAQLTEAIRANAPAGSRISQRIKAAFKPARGQPAPSTALDKMRATIAAVWDWYTRPPGIGDFESSLREFSGDMQRVLRSTYEFAKQIRKSVPDPIKREAIVNWIQADGDTTILTDRATKSKGSLKEGYEAALDLSAEERAIAQNVRQHLDEMKERGLDAGVIHSAVENYVTQIWNRDSAFAQGMIAEFSGKLNPDFKYARKRIFESYFEGEQAGFVPKQKDIGFLVSAYDTAFGRALASRGLMKVLMKGKAQDGRPLVAVSGKGIPVKGEEGIEAHLVKPSLKPSQMQDYRAIDHPALRKWTWAGSDKLGHPIMLQGDLVVHPQIYDHLSNILTRSWFQTSQGLAAKVGRGILRTGAEYKRMLLSLSGFHQTQEGLHTFAHRVSPFLTKPIDLNNPMTNELLDGSLVIAGDRAAMQAFSEGVYSSGLVSKIPVLGRLAGGYEDWLFNEYIPRLKVATGTAIFKRNLERYSKRLTRKQIAALSADQANAAFGAMNYDLLGRNKTMQNIFQLTALAPDFLEARARFVGQAFRPWGREQLAALLFQAGTLFLAARVLNYLLDDDFHWDKPISLVYKGREYGLRTIVGDLIHLVQDPRSFFYHRMSPAVLRPMVEMLTGRDAFGRKRSARQQLEDFAKGAVPIPLQGAIGQGRDQEAIESIAVAMGGHERRARTEAEWLAERSARDYFPQAEMTEEEEEKARMMGKAKWQLREGEISKEHLAKMNLSTADKLKLVRRAATPDLASNVRVLPINQALEVWKKATAEERKLLRPILAKKATNAMKKMLPADRAALRAKLEQAGRSKPWTPLVPRVVGRIKSAFPWVPFSSTRRTATTQVPAR